MSPRSHIVGVPALMSKFKRLQQEARESNVTVVTGFIQRYAIYVHEMLELRHDSGKQAKFLESPAIWMTSVIANTVVEGFTKTHSLVKGLLAGGKQLQVAAQDIVPIDTSALHVSAFTCLEKDLEAVSEAAFAKSEAIRITETKARGSGKSFKGRMLKLININIARRKAKK